LYCKCAGLITWTSKAFISKKNNRYSNRGACIIPRHFYCPQVYRTCRTSSLCRTTVRRWWSSGRHRSRAHLQVTWRTWSRKGTTWAPRSYRNAWPRGLWWPGRTGHGNSSDSCTRQDGGSSSASPPSTRTAPADTRRRPSSFSLRSDRVSSTTAMSHMHIILRHNITARWFRFGQSPILLDIR